MRGLHYQIRQAQSKLVRVVSGEVFDGTKKIRSGQIIDATFVTVPKQRNAREENEIIKEGAIPIEWGQNPYTLSQEDIKVLWTKKNNESFYGYKVSVQRYHLSFFLF